MRMNMVLKTEKCIIFLKINLSVSYSIFKVFKKYQDFYCIQK